MGAPINSFEIIESIRFFAQLVGTLGVDESNRTKINVYISQLLEALEPSVREATAKASGLTLLK